MNDHNRRQFTHALHVWLMTGQTIHVDNAYGRAALKELDERVDYREFGVHHAPFPKDFRGTMGVYREWLTGDIARTRRREALAALITTTLIHQWRVIMEWELEETQHASLAITS